MFCNIINGENILFTFWGYCPSNPKPNYKLLYKHCPLVLLNTKKYSVSSLFCFCLVFCWSSTMVLSKPASDSDLTMHATSASRYVRDSLPRYIYTIPSPINYVLLLLLLCCCCYLLIYFSYDGNMNSEDSF